MKIQIHNKLQQPQEIEATRVVVLDSLGNPIVVALETDPGVIISEIASPTNMVAFNALLKALGIDKTVIVHDAAQKPLTDITIK